MAFPARMRVYSQLLLGCVSIVHLARAAELQILIYDCSGIDSRTIEKTVSELRTILSFAEADVNVTACRDEANSASAESSRNTRTLELWILRGRAKKPNDYRQPLGYSVMTRTGGHALIFGEAVLTQANAADVPWSVLVAYTAAHEIGHLILGVSHSKTGLMKPNWVRKDIQEMYRNAVHFSSEQQRLIAAYCGRSREIEMAQKPSSRVPSRGRPGHAAD